MDPLPQSGLPIDDRHAPIYTVGQVASMLQVQPAFLRRLDTEEVVQPARSDGGQRRYTRSDIDRVAQVAALASEGLTLAGIRRLMTLEAQVTDLKRQLVAEQAKRRPSGDAYPSAEDCRPVLRSGTAPPDRDRARHAPG